MKPDFVVCGPTKTDDSDEGHCSQCGSVVYPTIGTLAMARREEIPLLCMPCWRKQPECQFGGVVHHGKMVGKVQGHES